MFKKFKNSIGKLFDSDDDSDKNDKKLPDKVPEAAPPEAPPPALEKPKVVLSRAELKLHSLWCDYTRLGKHDTVKQSAAWDQIVPVLIRVAQDRGENIDDLSEVHRRLESSGGSCEGLCGR